MFGTINQSHKIHEQAMWRNYWNEKYDLRLWQMRYLQYREESRISVVEDIGEISPQVLFQVSAICLPERCI